MTQPETKNVDGGKQSSFMEGECQLNLLAYRLVLEVIWQNIWRHSISAQANIYSIYGNISLVPELTLLARALIPYTNKYVNIYMLLNRAYRNLPTSFLF